MSTERSSNAPQPAPVDFKDIASKFAGKEASIDSINALAERMQALDTKLRSSTGEIIVLKYHTREAAAVAVARTNGEGLEVYEDPDTHTKRIKLGAGAAIHRTVFAGNTNELITEESLTITENSDLFNPNNIPRDLMVGEEEIKKSLRKIGANEMGEICLLLGDIGIDVDAFLGKVYEPEEITHLGITYQLGTAEGRDRAIAEITKAMNKYRRALGRPEVETEEVDHTVHVRPITVDEENRIRIGDEDLQAVYAQLKDPVVSLEEVERILRDHIDRDERINYLGWTGSSVLRDVVINGIGINRTISGSVISRTPDEERKVGSYMRLNPVGTDDQSMIIFWDKENGENEPR